MNIKSLILSLTALGLINGMALADPVALIGEIELYQNNGEPGGIQETFSGDYDSGTHSFNFIPDNPTFFGLQWSFTDGVLYEAGTHTVTLADGGGSTVQDTFVVPPGHVGGVFAINWLIDPIGVIMVWDENGQVIDDDNDGIRGHTFITGPLLGLSFTFDTTPAIELPSLSVDIVVSGGLTQECSDIGGSQVLISSDISTPELSDIPTIAWKIDGELVSNNASIQPFLGLGMHTIEVDISLHDGNTASDSTQVVVQDTTPPDLQTMFVDVRTDEVITSIVKRDVVRTVIIANDICDANPATQATIGLNAINNGVVVVDPRKQGVILKSDQAVDNLELNSLATDSSGNMTIGSASVTVQ